jgi:hypothetical protein
MEALEEQRHLLRKSVSAICEGDLAEAIRVATTIRVLVHETSSSKPLLKQLASNYLELEILDKKGPEHDQELPAGTHAAVVLYVPIGLTLSAGGTFLNPTLPPENYVPSIIGKWWERPSLILPGLGGFSRRQLILGLANKEGGAHIDLDVSQRYQQLMDSKSLRIGWSEGEVAPIKVSRLMAGQAGIELLDCLDRHFSSPD